MIYVSGLSCALKVTIGGVWPFSLLDLSHSRLLLSILLALLISHLIIG